MSASWSGFLPPQRSVSGVGFSWKYGGRELGGILDRTDTLHAQPAGLEMACYLPLCPERGAFGRGVRPGDHAEEQALAWRLSRASLIACSAAYSFGCRQRGRCRSDRRRVRRKIQPSALHEPARPWHGRGLHRAGRHRGPEPDDPGRRHGVRRPSRPVNDSQINPELDVS